MLALQFVEVLEVVVAVFIQSINVCVQIIIIDILTLLHKPLVLLIIFII